MGKKNPDTPDVKGAAEAEGDFARETARDANYANHPDQYNAMGSNTWQQQSVRDPATGEMTTRWTQRQNLSPDMQANFDAEMQRNTRTSQMAAGLSDRVASEMGAPLNWDQFGGVMAGPTSQGAVGGKLTSQGAVGTGLHASAPIGANISGTTGDGKFAWDSNNRQRAEDASYRRSTQRLDPQFATERATLERQMAGRGLRQGDSAYDSAMRNYSTGKNDAYEMARLGSVSEGRTEDQQSFGQADSAWDNNRNAEQQRFTQQATRAENARAANQQSFMQQATTSENARLSDQQAFNQQATTAENARASDQQAFDQRMQANERANALRNQQIEEYVSKRNHSLNEQNALVDSTTTGDIVSAFGG